MDKLSYNGDIIISMSSAARSPLMITQLACERGPEVGRGPRCTRVWNGVVKEQYVYFRVVELDPPPARTISARAHIIKRGREAEERVWQMLLVFMIFIKELTNQILLPRTRIVADSAFSSEWRCAC